MNSDDAGYYHLRAIGTLIQLIDSPNCPANVRKAANAELLRQVNALHLSHPSVVELRPPDEMVLPDESNEEIPF